MDDNAERHAPATPPRDPEPERTRYADLLAEAAGGAAVLPADWGQGRSIFGGLSAALALRAARSRVDDDRPPRSILVSFVGPVTPGEVKIDTRVLAAGRSAVHLQATLEQEGQARTVVMATFGRERESSLTVAAPPRPSAPPPDGLPAMPKIPGLVPAFTRHFGYRWTGGGLPYSGSEESVIHGWCRFVERAERTTEEWILGLVDAWPAPVVSMMSTPAPASTMTWGVDFVRVEPEAPTDDWWLFESRTEQARGGYAQTRAALWSPAGDLAAVSRQTVAYYA